MHPSGAPVLSLTQNRQPKQPVWICSLLMSVFSLSLSPFRTELQSKRLQSIEEQLKSILHRLINRIPELKTALERTHLGTFLLFLFCFNSLFFYFCLCCFCVCILKKKSNSSLGGCTRRRPCHGIWRESGRKAPQNDKLLRFVVIIADLNAALQGNTEALFLSSLRARRHSAINNKQFTGFKNINWPI